MERHFRLFLLGIFVMFGFAKPAFATSVATSFQLPLTNYPTNDGCLEWGGYNSVFPGQRHVADDACASAGTDVLAVANGVIKFAGQYKSCTNWGYLIIIEHTLPDGSVVNSIYGHIAPISGISAGVEINKGEHIGDIVSMSCWSDHIHFGIYVGSYSDLTCSYDASTGSGSCKAHGYISDWPGNYVDPTDFIADHQIDCTAYTSEFDATYADFSTYIGSATTDPSVYGSGSSVCIKEHAHKSGGFDGTSAILFDSEGGANQAYLVRSGFWNHYSDVCGGPAGNCNQNGVVDCGAPINNEYSQGTNTARQDFQSCYLYWNGTTASANPYPEVAPGWFDDSGWQGDISYAFAEAYELNGSRNDMGEAVEQFGNPAGVHHWGDNSSLPYVQDFEGGNYGWSILMYNEDFEAAYAIHTDFWETYRDAGPATYGVACSDEYEGDDGYTYQEFASYLFQWTGSRTRVYDKGYDECTSFSISSTSAGLTAVIDPSTFIYTSQVLTNLASADYADLSSSVTCAVDEADSLYVVLNGQDGRIYEFESTDDGVTWTSTHLTSVAAVPLSAPGTSPHLFIDPDTGDRYVTFMGVNARINLFHYNGTSWSAVELTSVVAAPLADITSSPFGYIANGVIYVVFQGNDQRIWWFTITNGTSYGSLDLTGRASVQYAMPGTSPMAVYNDLTGEHHIVFQGSNQRIQRLTYNDSTWSSVEITSVVNSDLLDSASSPMTYVDPFTGYVYTVINGVNERIDLIVDYHTSWDSDELTSLVSVPLTEPGTSPTGYIDPFTGNHVITLTGDDLRINQFEGPDMTAPVDWTSIDQTSQASVEYAAPGTSPATCVDPVTGVRHTVFVGDNGRIQYLRYGP